MQLYGIKQQDTQYDGIYHSEQEHPRKFVEQPKRARSTAFSINLAPARTPMTTARKTSTKASTGSQREEIAVCSLP